MEYFKENETRLEFGGFYESVHCITTDDAVEYFIRDYNEEHNTEYEEFDFDIDYNSMHEYYIKEYCKGLSEFILKRWNIKTSFYGLKLISPEYYNYSTDEIECFCTNADKIREYFSQDEDFLEHLKESTASYDGYTSYYKIDQALNNENNILLLYIFQHICEIWNKEEMPYWYIVPDVVLNKPEPIVNNT